MNLNKNMAWKMVEMVVVLIWIGQAEMVVFCRRRR